MPLARYFSWAVNCAVQVLAERPGEGTCVVYSFAILHVGSTTYSVGSVDDDAAASALAAVLQEVGWLVVAGGGAGTTLDNWGRNV